MIGIPLKWKWWGYKKQDKVIFHQPYVQKYLQKMKRTYVVGIQDEFMRIVANKFS